MLTMKSSLYNPDGTLSTEAHYFASTRPDNILAAEWSNERKKYKASLSPEEAKEFERLIRKKIREKHYSHPENIKKKKVQDAAWQKNNPGKCKSREARYRSKFRFFIGLRNTCYRVVKQLSLGKKPTSTFKWIGCSQEELKARFESLFAEGMTWENYGEWHVDHIRPICSFTAEEWEQVNHYTNLQPLWAEDNSRKGGRFIIHENLPIL
jgi:hypothetical protein